MSLLSTYHRFKKNNLLSWFKIFLPQEKLRYYPPQFILRNPLVSSVERAFKNGFEVAVLFFQVSNLRDLTEKVGTAGIHHLTSLLKKEFQLSASGILHEENILVIHDYHSEGITVFLKVDPKKLYLSEIDIKSFRIIEDVMQRLSIICPALEVQLNSGYMFMDKRHYSLEEAINKAQEQAVAMAEKKIQSEFNHLLYTMTQIINSKDIRLLAQPIFDVATREIKAYEVLTRGPAGTEMENPLRLFSVARQTGLLYDLEIIVLEKTLQQISLNGSSQNVFINFTPMTVGNPRFLKEMKNLLGIYSYVLPSQIVIEITERDSIEGIDHLLSNIRELRKMGLRIAVDDTGAGYASFHTINELMPDIIKIDRSVIHNIDNSPVKESMLKGLLLIAKETGSIVVAEGIESEKEAMVLSKNKVELAQGYYYARPAKIEKVKFSS